MQATVDEFGIQVDNDIESWDCEAAFTCLFFPYSSQTFFLCEFFCISHKHMLTIC